LSRQVLNSGRARFERVECLIQKWRFGYNDLSFFFVFPNAGSETVVPLRTRSVTFAGIGNLTADVKISQAIPGNI